MGLYSTKGEQLVRTHKPCPKCGPGTFLAEHADRRSCGRCGYSESKTESRPASPTPVLRGKSAKAAPAT